MNEILRNHSERNCLRDDCGKHLLFLYGGAVKHDNSGGRSRTASRFRG